jgi:arsenate reductase
MNIISFTEKDYPQIATIYANGIATGEATFQTEAPDWESWDRAHLPHCRIAAVDNDGLAGWAALSPVSSRCVYAGVAEVSVYIAENYRGRGIGKILMQELIRQSEEQGIWTLQSGIFPENKASIRLHEKSGFRIIGYREKVGCYEWRMERYDNHGKKKQNSRHMKKILVLCTGNSCRSQIAEAYLRKFAQQKAEIFSAGIEAHGLNPNAILTMKEDGIDISHHTSNTINEYLGQSFDLVLTVCDNARERCPVFPSSAKVIHHNFPDPAKAMGSREEILQQFREVREMIKEYCAGFIEKEL